MDFAEVVEKYELENEDELRKALEESDISEDAVDGLVKAARVVSSVSDEVTGDELEKTFHALGYESDTGGNTTDDADTDDAPGVTKATDTDTDDDADEVTKSDLVKRLDSLESENDELRKKLEDREADEALQKWISKAEEFDALSDNAESIGKTLRAIEKAESTEAAENHFDMLRGADEAVEKSGLFDEVGVSGSGETSDAEERLEKAIEQELEKASDEGEDINRYEAKKRALREMDDETADELRGRA